MKEYTCNSIVERNEWLGLPLIRAFRVWVVIIRGKAINLWPPKTIFFVDKSAVFICNCCVINARCSRIFSYLKIAILEATNERLNKETVDVDESNDRNFVIAKHLSTYYENETIFILLIFIISGAFTTLFMHCYFILN